MAFTWEVEALRKLIEGIVEEVEIKQAGEELAQEAIDAYNKRPEANQLWDVYKEEWVPDPDEGLGGLMAELAEEAGYEPDLPWFKGEKPTHAEIRAEARRHRDIADEGNRLAREQIEREAAELAAYENYGILPKSGNIPVDRRRFLNPKGPKETAELKKFREHFDPRSDLKLDWVNEILKEFPEDKAPEVLRLPHWTTPVPDHLKDEEKPDMSPFLSYLLRQSPYARLPVAGLLGLGLMGYSKPAY